MKKYLIIPIMVLGLSACVGLEHNQSTRANAAPQQSGQSVPLTPEQYAKLADAINKNKKQIIDQLNKGLNENLQGKTISVAPQQE
ncbi:hypothetical protein EDC45_1364 [Mesocricetibacter intestinalis]|uniref:Lipoprotein n=1 Tax=Mesocricetibacter intestinalis TaxID=1521930 RepID=A0A4R6V7Y3_9PAST|nr:hypothetical protein [Mesocricetibacter intestinalis]TDQ57716.1 hypothetical protein EDC45_1364 [Mesocricetibacter intestinalis]